MAGFSAETVASDYDYDLAPYGGSGRVPLPSVPEMRKFRERVLTAEETFAKAVAPLAAADNAIIDDARSGDGRSFTEDEQTAMRERSDQVKALRDTMTDAVTEALVDICAGHPSHDEINGLPAPVLFGFRDWLLELFAPLL